MYAIVDIAGQQFKVEKDQEIFVHRLEGEEGANVEFNEGAKISAKIISHLKGDKILVFKKKRRKGYKKTTGHRQYLSKIQIENITEKAAKPAKAEVKDIAPAKIETKPKASPKKKAETTPKSVTKAKPVSKTKAEVKSKVAPKKKAETTPKSVTKAKPVSKTKAEVKSKVAPKKKTEAKPKTVSKAKTTAKAASKPNKE
jgi:large subunit ribosomal protein L21